MKAFKITFGSTKTIGMLVVSVFYAASIQAVCNPQITPSTPTDRFIDHLDGTVTDKKTNLMWAKCPLGRDWSAATGLCSGNSLSVMFWGEAIALVDAAEVYGYSDWRVPNIKELESVVEVACAYPAVNTDVFPIMPSDISSTYTLIYFAPGGRPMYWTIEGNGKVVTKLDYGTLHSPGLVRDVMKDQ